MLSDEIKRNLIIEYWLSDTDELQCLEDNLVCEITEGGNTPFVTAVLNEVHSLVVYELNERYRQQAFFRGGIKDVK